LQTNTISTVSCRKARIRGGSRTSAALDESFRTAIGRCLLACEAICPARDPTERRNLRRRLRPDQDVSL